MSFLRWVACGAAMASIGLGCGDDGSGTGGTGGSGGSGAGHAGGHGGEAPEGGAGPGGEDSQGGAEEGGAGGGAPQPELEVCEGALRCVDASTYFCDEISGPDREGAFEEACAEQGGTFGAAPCSNNEGFFWAQACLFDCVTPNEYSSIGLDQETCEEAGGLFVVNDEV